MQCVCVYFSCRDEGEFPINSDMDVVEGYVRQSPAPELVHANHVCDTSRMCYQLHTVRGAIHQLVRTLLERFVVHSSMALRTAWADSFDAVSKLFSVIRPM